MMLYMYDYSWSDNSGPWLKDSICFCVPAEVGDVVDESGAIDEDGDGVSGESGR